MPRFLELTITPFCNLNCAYCYERESMLRTRQFYHMSLKTGKTAIDLFLTKEKYKTDNFIAFLGGEPLINFSFIRDLVRYTKKEYSKKQIFFLLSTNGLLFNKEIIKFIKTNKILVKLSVHGNNNGLSKNINDLLGYRNLGITIVVNKNTGKLYDQFIYFVNLGIKRFYFNFDFINSDFNDNFLNILKGELRRISDFIIKQNGCGGFFINYIHGKTWNQLCRLDNAVTNKKPCFMKNYEEGNLYIMPTGDIFPCSIGTFTSSKDKYDFFRIGNINTSNYLSIKKNILGLAKGLNQEEKNNLFCLEKKIISTKTKVEGILKKEHEYSNRAILGNVGN